MEWICDEAPTAEAEALARTLGVSLTVARLLLQRGLGELPAARAFLEPRLRDLDDPFAISHLGRAAERLLAAIERRESILIFGDYDVDGISSVALLVSFLREYRIEPATAIPLRLEEGYGLSRTALERALAGCREKPTLLVAVDCGTNSRSEERWLHRQGIDLMVIDHHTVRDPAARVEGILVNPAAHEGDRLDLPWRLLCSAGLVFKLIHGSLKRLREEGDATALRIRPKAFLDLVALATLADLVNLVGENRTFARHGLRVLQERRRLGLATLMEAARLEPDQLLQASDVGFRLGPLINASGRLADAADPLALFLSTDAVRSRQIALRLEDLNRQRQQLERKIFQAALEQIEANNREAPGLVAYDPDWHPGVAGIVASRLVHRYHRPCVVLGGDGGLARGSGRSVRGVDLVAVLLKCAGLLEGWGGHPMAAGVHLDPEQADEFHIAFAEAVGRAAEPGALSPRLHLAAWLEPSELTEALRLELDRMEPFGMGNPEPVFGIRAIRLAEAPRPMGKEHIRCFLATRPGFRLYAVGWNLGHRPPPEGRAIDLAGKLQWNVYNGQRFPRFEILDWR